MTILERKKCLKSMIQPETDKDEQTKGKVSRRM